MIKSDYKVYNMNIMSLLTGLFTCHTFYLVMLYRVGNYLLKHNIPFLPFLFRAWGIILFSADISPVAKIGKSFRIAHSVGIVIGDTVTIGDNFQCFQNVTLGGRNVEANGRKMPQIGNNVTVFSGACVLGPIVIGDNVLIGANSVVLKDIENNVVVAGSPAKVVNRVEKKD